MILVHTVYAGRYSRAQCPKQAKQPCYIENVPKPEVWYASQTPALQSGPSHDSSIRPAMLTLFCNNIGLFCCLFLMIELVYFKEMVHFFFFVKIMFIDMIVVFSYYPFIICEFCYNSSSCISCLNCLEHYQFHWSFPRNSFWFHWFFSVDLFSISKYLVWSNFYCFCACFGFNLLFF